MADKSYRILAWVTLLLFSVTTIHAQSFAGRWKGISKGEEGIMVFDKKGYVTFINGGTAIGGKDYDLGGIKFSMHYESDAKASPSTIDFVMYTEPDHTEVARMLGIYKFEDKKTLLINMDFEGRQRPVEFDPEDENQITLHKSK